jgi:hypothetical protein
VTYGPDDRPTRGALVRCATGVTASLLVLLAGCSSPAATGERTAGGVPVAFYDALDDALAAEPDVGSTALMDLGGPCPLGDEVVLDGEGVEDVSAHGVVRLGGDVPAVLCDFYDDVPVTVMVARADDDDTYAALREASGPTDAISAQEQSGQQVEVGDRTIDVVRVVYVTNPAAGTGFVASYWDEQSRGLVQLDVSDSDARSADYDEEQAAADLARFLTG